MKEFYPKVSIIIPVYTNDNNSLKRAIDSALTQSYNNIEVIVINTTSDEMIKNLIKSYDSKISSYKCESDTLSKALNIGIKKMTGDYFSVLEQNDAYYANKIEREIIALNILEDKNTIIFSNYETYDEHYNNKEIFIQNDTRIKKYPEIAIIKQLIHHSTVLISKTALEKCGIFNEKLLLTEYYDKYLDLAKKFNFYHIPDVLVSSYSNKNNELLSAELFEKEYMLLDKKIKQTFDTKRIEEIFENQENYYKEIIALLKEKNLQIVLDYYKKELSDILIKKLKYKPLISVIIPVYNGSNYIEEAISSVLKQTYSNYEIIVVNDGSTDNGQTKKVVLKYEDKVKYFEKANGGVASALNYGISKAKGEYISWLSHDDIYNDDKLLTQVEVLNNLSNKKTILFSNFELINEKSKVYAKTDFYSRLTKQELENNILPVLKGTTNGCTMLIPKSIIEETGGFDESKKTTNDYIMWFKIFSKYPIEFIPNYLIKYRIHNEQDTKRSPVYIDESEEMWSTVFEQLDNSYIKKLNYEPLVFYADFYNQMKESGLDKSAAILLEKYNKLRQKEKPIISVIMPCYNSEKYLEESINSILNQTFTPLELICVDDDSSDNTYKLLCNLSKIDDRIIVTKNEFKKGVSGAMNTGLKYAKGKYIARMDSDDISDKDRLMTQYRFLENNPKYGICSTNINLMDEMGNVFSSNQYKVDKSPIEWQFLWSNPVPCAPCMYRKEILNNIKFSEDFSTAEDYEFLSHIVDKGIYFIDKGFYFYRIYSSSLFQKNFIKTMINSQLVSKEYYKKITHNNDLPEFFEQLTSYSTYQASNENISQYEMIKFLDKTLEEFKKYFNWSDTEVELARNYMQTPYDNFIIRSNTTIKRDLELEKNYNDIINSTSWKVTKPLRKLSEIIRKSYSKIRRKKWKF